MNNSWLHELSGLISASDTQGAGGPCVVRVRCGEFVKGIDLATGQSSSGDDAISEISADETTLTALIRGEITLQGAFRSGSVRLTGDPEPFLRLAVILDRVCSADVLVPQ